MDKWLAMLYELVKILTRDPATPTEQWTVVGVTALVMLFVFDMVARSTRIANSDAVRSVVTMVLGGAMMLAAAIAVMLYVRTDFGLPQVKPWLPLAAAVLTWLAVVIPLTALWQRARYLEAAIPWFAALVFGVLAVYGVGAAFDAAAAGRQDAAKARRHKAEIEQILRNK